MPDDFSLTTEDAWAILMNVSYINNKSMKVFGECFARKLDPSMEINVLKDNE